jgi:hypothetical protein
MTRRRGPRNDEEEGVVLTKREDLGMTRRGASRHDKRVELPHPKPVIASEAKQSQGLNGA